MSEQESSPATLQTSAEHLQAAASEAGAMAGRAAFVLGYTGESGKALVKELTACDAIKRLVLIGRREVKLETPAEKIEQKIIDFDKVDEFKASFSDCDVGYCCLGTTRGKAGKEGFVKVDHDYVMNTAKIAKDMGCKHLHLVSSTGANEKSWFLYPHVKGQVETELKALGFERLSIYRPAVLMCNREERRTGEAVLRTLLKPVAAVAPTLATTPTEILAKAMLNNTLNNTGKQVDLFENKDIFRLADMSYFKTEPKS